MATLFLINSKILKIYESFDTQAVMKKWKIRKTVPGAIPIGQAQKADVWRQAPASAAVRAWVVLKL